MTLPLETWQAVAGKFLAAWAFTGIALALTFPIWITVNYLGDPDNGVIVAAYFGSILMAGGFLAVGACISAATKNQVIAFILSVVICFLLLAPGLGVVQNCSRALRRNGSSTVSRAWGPGALRLHQQGRHRPARPRLFRAADRLLRSTPTRSCSSSRRPTDGMSGATRNKLGGGTLVLIVLRVRRGRRCRRTCWLRGVRVDLDGEQPLHARRRHASACSTASKSRSTCISSSRTRRRRTLPSCARYATRVREMLEEFAANAPDGKLVLNVVDPLPFSEEEDRAAQFGLQARARRRGRRRRLLRPRRHEQRRHDGPRSRSSSPIRQGSVPRVRPREAGLQPREHRQAGRRLARRARRSAAASIRRRSSRRSRGSSSSKRKQLLEVRTLPASVLTIDDDIDVLWIVHPDDARRRTLYAIDQFVHARRPRADLRRPARRDHPPGADPTGSGSAPPRRARRSQQLFHAWGVTFDTPERRRRQPLRA